VVDANSNEVIANFANDNETGAYYVSLPTGKEFYLNISSDKYVPYKDTVNIPDTILDPNINKAIIMQKMQSVTKYPKVIIDNKEVSIDEIVALNKDTVKSVTNKKISQNDSISKQKITAVHLNGTIIDEYTRKPLAAKVKLVDGYSYDIIADFTTDNKTGTYFISLPTEKTIKLTVSADKYMPYTETIETYEPDVSPEINRIIKLHTVASDSLGITKNPIAHIKGIVFDEFSLKPIAGIARIKLVNAANNEVISNSSTERTTGVYYLSLPTEKTINITVTADGYTTYTETIFISDTASNDINKTIILHQTEMASKNSKFIIDSKGAPDERIVLKNVLFDFDKYTLRDESTAELDKWVSFLKSNPGLKIEISGHTDNKGSAQYNLELSENRAKTVRDYFVSHGISADRIKWKGYGLGQPVATNLTEEGRQKNRRIEIKFINAY
jgi:outer membrane protein OmpA-like peptidoglycan-associated protein